MYKQSFYKEYTEAGAFVYDFSKVNKCFGTLFIEVKPVNPNGVLVLNGIEEVTFENPFVLESPTFPIIRGELKFTPKDGNNTLKSIVRLILVEK